MNIIDRIARNGYAASEREVEQLASVCATGARGSGTYLRVLVAACQAASGPRRVAAKHSKEPLAVFESVHGRLYAAVKRGCGTEDPSEVNRRCTFARSAASSLRSYLGSGGSLAKLKPSTVTKRVLAPTKRTPQERFANHVAQLIAAAHKLGPEALAQLRDAVADTVPEVVATTLERRRVAADRAAAH